MIDTSLQNDTKASDIVFLNFVSFVLITFLDYRTGAFGATDTPRTPALSIARVTSPEAFTSSMNSRR
jgi:hypothetical protein